MALRRKTMGKGRADAKARPARVEGDGLAPAISYLADLKASSDLLFSYSLTIEKPGQAATIAFFARQVKELSSKGLVALEDLRAMKRPRKTSKEG